jgi:hypothetical protein
LDDAALEALLRGPSGAVAADIERRCIAVESMAKRLCPVDTGRLRASISHTLGEDDGEVVGYVGSNVVYAPPVEFRRPFLRPALDAAR